MRSDGSEGPSRTQAQCQGLVRRYVTNLYEVVIRLQQECNMERHTSMPIQKSCDGRVVKALDSKSNGYYLRMFEAWLSA